MSDAPTIPPGDPVWTVHIWRQDSITLARLRPVLEQFMLWADIPCEHHAPPMDCRSEADGHPCWPCQFKVVRARLHRIGMPGGNGE